MINKWMEKEEKLVEFMCINYSSFRLPIYRLGYYSFFIMLLISVVQVDTKILE